MVLVDERDSAGVFVLVREQHLPLKLWTHALHRDGVRTPAAVGARSKQRRYKEPSSSILCCASFFMIAVLEASNSSVRLNIKNTDPPSTAGT